MAALEYEIQDGNEICRMTADVAAGLFCARRSAWRHACFQFLGCPMPSVSEQMALPGNRANPNLAAGCFLLKPSCNYQEALETFTLKVTSFVE
jgi:hypothetical protein